MFFAGTVYAECKLQLPDSPSLANIRLGMTVDQANAALGGKPKLKSKGERRTNYFRFKQGKAKGPISGAKAFWVRFYQGRVYSVEIFYHSGYGDLEGLIETYASRNGFDVSLFETKHGYSRAKCDGFSVKADLILNPHLELIDTNIKELLDK